MNEKIPKLGTGQFSIVFAERSTGIILTPDGNRYLGQGEFFAIFNSLDEAEAYARNRVEHNPELECSIRDCDGNHVKFV